MSADVIGTGLAFPVRLDPRGAVALSSGDEDVREAILIILSTAPGERPMRPEFGCDIHQFVFERIDSTTTGRMDRAVREALHRWEPRITVEAVAFDVDHSNEGILMVRLDYRLRATSARHNLVYPFYVVPAE
ncbi:MAG TPA: GPW/gp25 family protein [Solirubrobacteraceae bacterium]|nr:GPW/gp25 family protein [Solirubrobacteraceae bacterium]